MKRKTFLKGLLAIPAAIWLASKLQAKQELPPIETVKTVKVPSTPSISITPSVSMKPWVTAPPMGVKSVAYDAQLKRMRDK